MQVIPQRLLESCEMMNRIKVYVNFNNDTDFVEFSRGVIINGNSSIDPIKLKIQNVEEIESYLSNIKGSFSCLLCKDEKLFMAVDIIRSYPIYYTILQDKILVSDNANKIASFERLSIDVNNENEIRRCSYVTQDQTLFKDVFQICAGEYLVVSLDNAKRINGHYYDYTIRKSDDRFNIDKTINRFEQCLSDVFLDLIDRNINKTFVIPLSGGCDSRTVAVMFKKLQYENVICFSYGKKNNTESLRSEAIAKALGYKWIFVEYSEKVWSDIFSSDMLNDYLYSTCLGDGIGCVQALPAILFLKKNRLIPDDSVIVPGHAMDFLAGNRMKKHNEYDSYKKADLINYILKIHYSLDSKRRNVKKAIIKWTNTIPESLDGTEFNSIYQKWEWKNRQSKFTVNDVRTYEYAGFRWEIPLWDIRIVDFWKSIPEKELFGRKFQYCYTERNIDPVAGMAIDYFPQRKNSRIKQLIKRCVPFLDSINVNQTVIYKLLNHRSNGNAFYDHLKSYEYYYSVIKYGGGFNINTIVISYYLKMIRGRKGKK